METVDILIEDGDLLTMCGDGIGYIGKGAVAIAGNSIAAVGRADEIRKTCRAKRVIDATDMAVLPGFIDGHLHTVIALLRGVGQDARSWHVGMDPYFNHMTIEAVEAGAQISAIEAIRAGTTTFCDIGPAMPLVLPFYERVGIRACVCSLISQVPPVESTIRDGELLPFDEDIGRQRLQENIEIIESWNGKAKGRISVMLGPQAADYCSVELFGEIYALAEKHNLRVHMHLAQDEREMRQVELRYGKRPVQFLQDLGFLSDRLIVAHLIYCTDDEVREVAESGAAMAFCPSSLLICDGILPPADVFLQAGGRVCLGTDETSSNNGVNLFSEMKIAALAMKMKRRDPAFFPAWQALRLVTIDGARALGLDDIIGSLEAGKRADIILIDLQRPSLAPVLRDPVRNLVPNLVLSARGDEVVLSMVDGRVIYENGKIITIDEKESLEFIGRAAREVNEGAAEEVMRRKTPQYRFTVDGKY